MSNRTIKHEIKLQPSVVVLLGLLTIAVCAYVFAPVFAVRNAEASFVAGDEMIVADAVSSANLWQLKDGKVRLCVHFRPIVGPAKCSEWSED